MMTTTTREIVRSEWPAFFDALSLRHDRRFATLEVFSPEIGGQVEAESLIFGGISADLKAGENRIAIQLGNADDANITHIISAPTRVQLERSELEHASVETLQVESDSGATTLVRFLAGIHQPAMGGVE